MTSKTVALMGYFLFQFVGVLILVFCARRVVRDAKAERKPGCRCRCHKHESQGGWRSTRCCPDCGRSLTGNVV